ncbi:MAG: hypothetical protein QM541_04610 [Flavobacterium sp.]|nr:hypothetical protein [Flavobacterium sp.]
MITNTTQEKVEAALNSINNISQAEMPPFFYTRLVAKIEQQAAPNWWQLLLLNLTKPAFAVVTLLLFVVLNITAIAAMLKDNQQSNNTAESSTIQGFAQEYNLSVSTVYNDKRDSK